MSKAPLPRVATARDLALTHLRGGRLAFRGNLNRLMSQPVPHSPSQKNVRRGGVQRSQSLAQTRILHSSQVEVCFSWVVSASAPKPQRFSSSEAVELLSSRKTQIDVSPAIITDNRSNPSFLHSWSSELHSCPGQLGE